MKRLAELRACFEGVIPSIIATSSADGTPNVSYLSHVVMVDEQHVGLSNQFFSKTAENIRANPRAALLLVDAGSGDQFRLDLAFVEARAAGEVFDHVKSQLRASSMQVGMAGIFRLRGVDVYRIDALRQVACPVETMVPATASMAGLTQAADIVRAVAEQSEVDAIVDTVLDQIRLRFRYENTMLLLHDPSRGILTTLGSRGYERSGVGSEVAMGEGIIGTAAADRRLIKVSDMSRVRRLGEAIRNSSGDENRTRTIALPGIAAPMSQIAVPMIAQGAVHGVLFAESAERLAFAAEDEAALSVVAGHTAAALLIAESLAGETPVSTPPDAAQTSGARPFRVTHHAYDDSVFIDNEYVIKGVSGRLLMFMLEVHSREGRRDFTNRELRLNGTIRLPDLKDNLESRLLLLRRRLEDKSFPLRLARTGRGRLSLVLSGRPIVDHAA
jgi:adenylate cyclase